MLKETGVTLEKISDPDKYMFSEQGMRGGVSYFNKRYSEAFKNKYILYFDMNNLYGCAMRQYLAISNFKWVKNVNNLNKNQCELKIIVQLDIYLK